MPCVVSIVALLLFLVFFQDEAVNKTTYPKLMGMEGARQEARR